MNQPDESFASNHRMSRARWVLAKSGLAHLDLGERSSQSMRVKADHVIVTLCRGHLDAVAEEVPSTYGRRCSNCVRAALSGPAIPRPVVSEAESAS